jgi:CheY-like chemotaxis protein
MTTKILAVDSDAEVLRLLDIRLKKAGYEVILTNNGSEALDLAQTAPPEVVITRVRLPGLDGLALTRRLKALPHPPLVILLTLLTGDHLTADSGDSPPGDGLLDASLRALLAEIAPPELQAVAANGNITGLSDGDRRRLALALAQKRNKVTHIYELIKAYGGDIQLEYNRADKVWQRREAIAAKHAQESSTNPFTGQRVAGAAHAPFIYAADPRLDLPEELQAKLETVLPGCDDIIIEGWLGEPHTD